MDSNIMKEAARKVMDELESSGRYKKRLATELVPAIQKTAELVQDASPLVWTQWSFEWEATPGTHTLAVRATDELGFVQGSDPPTPSRKSAQGE
jgi:hypothetical protein